MFKRHYLIYNVFFLFLFSCTSVEKQISDRVLVVNKINESSFSFLDEVVENKNIVFLGEPGHGYGKTREVTSILVKYLVEQKGFNTIAIEGFGFIDMEIVNNSAFNNSLFKNTNTDFFSYLGYVKQFRPLYDVIKQNKSLKFIGIESNDNIKLEEFLFIRLREIEANSEVIQKFENIYYIFYGDNPKNLNVSDLVFYSEQIQRIKNHIEKDKSNDLKSDFLIQALQNKITEAVFFQKLHLIGTEKEISIAVNLRDKQMAENFIWHLDRNPDTKVIVLTANFHGAKNIHEVRYKEGNDMYKNYKLFNGYIDEEYGDKVYSIAFTSSQGEVRWLGDTSPPHKITAPKNSLEYELHKKEIDFGFIDYEKIRKETPSLKNRKFNSTVLGDDDKSGKWLKVFDGVFYIRTNEPVEWYSY